jgi:hypothetical protein
VHQSTNAGESTKRTSKHYLYSTFYTKFFIYRILQPATLKNNVNCSNKLHGNEFNFVLLSVQSYAKDNELNVYLKLNDNDDIFTFMEDLNV